MLNRMILKHVLSLSVFLGFCSLVVFPLPGEEQTDSPKAATPADQPLILFVIGEEGYKTAESLLLPKNICSHSDFVPNLCSPTKMIRIRSLA